MATQSQDCTATTDNNTRDTDVHSVTCGDKRQLSEDVCSNRDNGDNVEILLDQSEEMVNGTRQESRDNSNLLYRVDQTPPWHLCLLLGFQQYLTSFGSTLTMPLILSVPLCVGSDMVGLSHIIATFFVVSGIATLLQTTIGIRLPIIQGATSAFLAPTIAILNLPEWKCHRNASGLMNYNMSLVGSQSIAADREEWQMRMREIQGAIIMAALIQVVVGASGLMSLVVRYVGPLTIAPTVTLIGFSLFRIVAFQASMQWWIALMTLSLIALFSQYLAAVNLPLPSCFGQKNESIKLPIFKLFPLLLGIGVSWFLCFILTVSGALPDRPEEWGYFARTDLKVNVIADTPWFRIPYPGQWGPPTFNARSVFGMLSGLVASVIESVGDYYACARLSGAPSPPPTAINRGIAVEGLGGLIAGVLGTGNGTTSYSENVASIGITRVGSLRVVQCAGLILIIMGCIGKFGAIFSSIPDPVMGGLFLVIFGMIAAVGLSNLQFVKMTSSRNLFVIATSFFVGMVVPEWMASNEGSIATGLRPLDDILHVLLSTNMFVGGLIGFFLDNTLPGTPEERGMTAWKSSPPMERTSGKQARRSRYQLPFCHKWLRDQKWTRFLPVCTLDDDVQTDVRNNSLNFDI